MIIRTEKIHFGRSVKLVTGFIITILAIFVLFIIYMIFSCDDIIGKIIGAIVLLFIAGLLLPLFSFRLKQIIITDHSLIISSNRDKKEIKYTEIQEVSKYNPTLSKGNVRTFGIGGLFGFIGDFKNKEIGNYTSYVGDYSQSFLIIMKSGEKYVVSCENYEEVIKEIQNRL
ncbi:PH domain-containing protein [uncultured Bacteroides sp.]|uniref:PH domain-containing protein n=1 Tax=uncultured Bacteroides sp. TaxID=162156 RepID=UPI00261087C1|nr:PH domain-containing protein [uncultured Bacteroides sp.]